MIRYNRKWPALVAGLIMLSGMLSTSMGSDESYDPKKIRMGQELFNQSCNDCHPEGENVFKPQLPLRSAPQLVNFETFLSYIRNPKARKGPSTKMPAFPKTEISELQAEEIYSYILRVLKK